MSQVIYTKGFVFESKQCNRFSLRCTWVSNMAIGEGVSLTSLQ